MKKFSVMFQLSHLNREASIYSYIPLSLYLCSLTVGYLAISETDGPSISVSTNFSILKTTTSKILTEKFQITEETRN